MADASKILAYLRVQHSQMTNEAVELIERQAARIAELEARPMGWVWCDSIYEEHTCESDAEAIEEGWRPLVCSDLAAPVADRAMANDAWQSIETAPKDRVLLLWVPTFSIWIDGPWRGAWSYVVGEWVLHTPITASDERAITISGIPHPTHWMPLPDAPDAASTEKRETT